MIVADASPLIALAKMQRLGLLKALYDEVVIGPVVKSETIDAGRAIAADGVEQIEAAVEDGWLRIVRLTPKERGLRQRLIRRSRLHRGEAESIALASLRDSMLIVDDKEARSIAVTLNVKHLGSAGVLLEAYVRDRLSLSELEVAVRELSKVVWLSPAVVAEILRRAREVDR